MNIVNIVKCPYCAREMLMMPDIVVRCHNCRGRFHVDGAGRYHGHPWRATDKEEREGKKKRPETYKALENVTQT